MPDTDESPSMQARSSRDSSSVPVAMAVPITAIPQTAAQLVLDLGWTMAVLYGTIEPIPADKTDGLRAASELLPADRRGLERGRLRHLLETLTAMPEFAGSGLPTEVPALAEDDEARQSTLTSLNLDILRALAVTRPETQLAYELGRALRDTVNPPDQNSLALPRQFARDRIATLQGWLAELSSEFAPQAAAVVSESLGHWTDFVNVAVSTSTARVKGGTERYHFGATMYRYLLRQGDLWLMLLIGPSSIAGFRGSQEILRRVRQRYGLKLVLLAAALGAAIYLIITYTSGALTVLTSVAAIGGALGISAKGIASVIATVVTKDASRPVSSLAGEAEQDAMAWAITTLPPVRLTPRAVRSLRRAGIAGSASLGKVSTGAEVSGKLTNP